MFNLKLKGKGKVINKLKKLANDDYSEFMQKAGKITVNTIVHNIKSQVEADGQTPLKRNALSTFKKKGHHLSLIDKGKLSSTSTYIINPKKKNVIIKRKSIRDKIGVYVEEKGYHFWGISPFARDKILKSWRNLIISWLKK